MKKILILLLLCIPGVMYSQINWDFSVEKKKGDTSLYTLKLHATLVDNWYMYSAQPIKIDMYVNPYLRYMDSTYVISSHLVKMGTEYYYSREVTIARDFRKYHSPEMFYTPKTPLRCTLTYLLCDEAGNCTEETKNLLIVVNL